MGSPLKLWRTSIGVSFEQMNYRKPLETEAYQYRDDLFPGSVHLLITPLVERPHFRGLLRVLIASSTFHI